MVLGFKRRMSIIWRNDKRHVEKQFFTLSGFNGVLVPVFVRVVIVPFKPGDTRKRVIHHQVSILL